MSNYIYFVGVSCGLIDLANFSHKYMTEDSLNKLGVMFSEDGGGESSAYISDGCISFKSAIDAIESYLFYSDTGEYHSIINIFEKRVDHFFSYEAFVIRKNVLNGMVKVLQQKDVSAKIDELFGMYYEENDFYSKTDVNIPFDDIIDKIENLVDDVCYLNMSSKKSSSSVCIIRENGFSHKLISESGYKYKKEFKRNQFYYNDTIMNLKRWITYNVSVDEIVGISINSPVSNGNNIHDMYKNNQRIFRKIYGLVISKKTDETIDVKYLNSGEVLKMTIDIESGKKIPPDKDNIYCNVIDDKDIICGFDLV